MVKTLVRAMANQGIHKEDPLVEKEARHREKQFKPQVEVGVTHISYSEFVKLQPLTFSRVDILEDP